VTPDRLVWSLRAQRAAASQSTAVVVSRNPRRRSQLRVLRSDCRNAHAYDLGMRHCAAVRDRELLALARPAAGCGSAENCGIPGRSQARLPPSARCASPRPNMTDPPFQRQRHLVSRSCRFAGRLQAAIRVSTARHWWPNHDAVLSRNPSPLAPGMVRARFGEQNHACSCASAIRCMAPRRLPRASRFPRELSLSLTVPSEARPTRRFHALAEGGQVRCRSLRPSSRPLRHGADPLRVRGWSLFRA